MSLSGNFVENENFQNKRTNLDWIHSWAGWMKMPMAGKFVENEYLQNKKTNFDPPLGWVRNSFGFISILFLEGHFTPF